MSLLPNSLTASLACLVLCSCDQAKNLLGKIEETTMQAIGSATENDSDAEALDPTLEKLIDRTEEGILFRKDLPFPTDLSVNVVTTESLTARIIRESQLGKDKISISSDSETSYKLARSGDTFRFSDYKQVHHEQNTTTEEGGPKQINNHPLSPPSPPRNYVMQLVDSKWTVKGRNFADLAMARELGPHIPQLMQEFALAPRAMWFGQRRIAPGKTIEVSGELLPMLITGQATGSLSITLQEIESVRGHPCAKFSIKGAYVREKTPSVDGRLFREETTIQSGNIWLSVIHPIVLKSQYDSISKITFAEGSGPSLIIQGNFQPTRTIEWQPL